MGQGMEFAACIRSVVRRTENSYPLIIVRKYFFRQVEGKFGRSSVARLRGDICHTKAKVAMHDWGVFC